MQRVVVLVEGVESLLLDMAEEIMLIGTLTPSVKKRFVTMSWLTLQLVQ
jgi:hypothetical protein